MLNLIEILHIFIYTELELLAL